MLFWRLSKNGTNHPSIAQRGVSCSKVGLGEPVPRRLNYYFMFWKHKSDFSIVLKSLV